MKEFQKGILDNDRVITAENVQRMGEVIFEKEIGNGITKRKDGFRKENRLFCLLKFTFIAVENSPCL